MLHKYSNHLLRVLNVKIDKLQALSSKSINGRPNPYIREVLELRNEAIYCMQDGDYVGAIEFLWQALKLSRSQEGVLEYWAEPAELWVNLVMLATLIVSAIFIYKTFG